MYDRFIFLENQNVLGELKIDRDRVLLEIEFLQNQINKAKFFIQDETLDNDEKIKIENRSSAYAYERDHMTEEKRQRYLLDIANKQDKIDALNARLQEIDADIEKSNARITEYRKGDAAKEAEPDKEEDKSDGLKPIDGEKDSDLKEPEDGLKPIDASKDSDLKEPEDGLKPIDASKDSDLDGLALGPTIEPDEEDLAHADDDKKDEEEVAAVVPAKEPLLRKWPKILGAAVAFITAFLAARFQQAGSLFNLDKDEIVTESDQEQEDDKDKEQEQGQPEQGQPEQGVPEQGQPEQGQPEQPTEPTQPEQPTEPEKPEEPEKPTDEPVIEQSSDGYPVYLEEGEAFVDEEAGVEITASGNVYDITGDEVTFDHQEDLEQTGKFSVVEPDNVKTVDVEGEKTGDEMSYDEAVETMSSEDLQNYNQGFSELDWDQLFSDAFGDELSK